jgi:hypothetical protein
MASLTMPIESGERSRELPILRRPTPRRNELFADGWDSI